MTFEQLVDHVVRVFEGAGVAVLVVGFVVGFVRWGRTVASRAGSAGTGAGRRLRNDLGAAILLGLEILVAADIIRTVAVDPTLESVAVLGLIVLIRTFLSFSLEVEIEGVWPWRRGAWLLGPGARDADGAG